MFWYKKYSATVKGMNTAATPTAWLRNRRLILNSPNASNEHNAAHSAIGA